MLTEDPSAGDHEKAIDAVTKEAEGEKSHNENKHLGVSPQFGNGIQMTTGVWRMKDKVLLKRLQLPLHLPDCTAEGNRRGRHAPL